VVGKFRPGREQGLEVGIEEREYATQNAKAGSLHFDSCDGPNDDASTGVRAASRQAILDRSV